MFVYFNNGFDNFVYKILDIYLIKHKPLYNLFFFFNSPTILYSTDIDKIYILNVFLNY